ncbi:MAG: S8 family serine peptidase [Chloroflexi bacterium]|nr:S8 family serine peptidase [Chloroflexota bacterium]
MPYTRTSLKERKPPLMKHLGSFLTTFVSKIKTLPQVVLLVILGVSLLFGSSVVNAAADSDVSWNLIRKSDGQTVCTIQVAHTGEPTLDEITQTCGSDLATGWQNGEYSLTQAAPTPAPTTIPSVRSFLETPSTAAGLQTNRPLGYLAGKLIAAGYVDVSSCNGSALLANGYANPCGLTAAQPYLFVWQNRFDTLILKSAVEEQIPAIMFKNLLIQESQMWPQASRHVPPEYGLGQLTENGTDTLLMWNNNFFKKICNQSLEKEKCKKDYLSISASERAILRGATLIEVRADCSNCAGKIDIKIAEKSVAVFGAALKANFRQVDQIAKNLTGRAAVSQMEAVEVWKLAAANYHAGPGCTSSAMRATLKDKKPLRWKNISKNFQAGCESAVDYVERMTITDGDVSLPTASQIESAARVIFGLPDLTLTPVPASVTPTVDPVSTGTATPDVSVSEQLESPHVQDQIVVKIDPKKRSEVEQVINDLGINLTDDSTSIEPLDSLVVDVDASQLTAVLTALQSSDGVEFAEPNYLVTLAGTPNDPEFPNQPNLNVIQVPQSWDALPGTEEVLVAVIDTGVDITHLDLVNSVWQNPGETGLDASGADKKSNGIDDDGNGYVDDWQGWNMVAGSNSVSDDQGHGTHLAGIIGAQTNNAIGIAGIAPNARLLPVKVLDNNGVGSHAQAAEGIVYATDMGARIINLGFGGIGSSDLLQNAVDYALSQNVLVVAAAGNGGNATTFYPAGYPGVIAVSAVDNDFNMAPFSSYGSHIGVSAPGAAIQSTFPGGGYSLASGTSMSSAHVSGVAALLASKPEFADGNALRSALLNSALDLGVSGVDEQFGYGVVQAFNALGYSGPLLPPPTPVVIPVDPGAGTVNMLGDAPNANIGGYLLSCPAVSSFTQQTGAGVIPVTAINVDNAVSGPIPLGFDFWYMGTRYTQVWVSSNGWISFNDPAGNTCTTDADSCPSNDLDNNSNTTAAGRPYLAPLWDNLSGVDGTASYTVLSTAPSRIFRFEWWGWRWTSTNPDAMRFRLELYESTGVIRFWYDQGAGALNAASASIGFTGTPNNVFRSAQTISACPLFNQAEVATLATKPTDGRIWTFSPPQNPTAPTNLSFSNVTSTAMTLNWTDNSINEKGFAVFRSTDNVNFNFAGQSLADVNSYSATGLTAGTPYYWRVYAVTEGALSAVLAGQQSTNTLPTINVAAPANNSTFLQGAPITFTATATDPEDGNISASLLWNSSIDGLIGTGGTFIKNNLSMGVHTITVTATDANNAVITSVFTITITDASGNTPPVLTIGSPANDTFFVQGTLISFGGSAIDAQDGDLSANIQWSSNVAGALGTGSSVSTSALAIGTHRITASVTDAGGLVGSTTIRVTITDAAGNAPPAVAISSPSNGDSFPQGSDIPFIGQAFVPLNADVSSVIQWTSSRDGAIGSGASFGITSLSIGTHTITASATDSAGRVGTDTITITIVSTGANPHGGFSAITDKCAICHRDHSAQSNPYLVGSNLNGNAYCLSCHNNGTTIVSTHSNKDWTGPRVEAPFELGCTQCHDPHGSVNLSSIRSELRVVSDGSVTTGPVLFTSRTGTNSFDDGVSATANRLCVACHLNPSNPGLPMTSHPGGENHNDGSNYSGMDCVACHKHSADSSSATSDGFMAAGCRACHSTVQDLGRGTPRRQIVGAGSDFARTSHHVSGNDAITDADCQVCHEMTQHKQGSVRLFNVDSPSTTVYVLDYVLNATDDKADYENFCKACHDGNGQAGNQIPFSDKKLIPALDSTLWTAAMHNSVVSTFSGSCLDCHDSGHGSNKTKLLSPWNFVSDGNPVDPMRQEERFCYYCHTTSGVGTNVQSAFSSYTNTATRFFKHNLDQTSGPHTADEVFGTRFGGTNRHVECGDCHGPHEDNSGTALAPVTKPQNIGATGVDPVFNGAGAPARFNFISQPANEYQVCFKCHSSYTTLPTYVPDGYGCATPACTGGRTFVPDGLRKLTSTNADQIKDTRDLASAFNPANASFHPLLAAGKNTNIPAGSFIAGWDSSSRVYCSDCHTNASPVTGANGTHASPLLHILDGSASGSSNYSTYSFGNEPVVPPTEICFKCHDYNTYVDGTASNTLFDNGNNLHAEHMSGGFTITTCYTCHNSHGSAQVHLINFDTNIVSFPGGQNSLTGFIPSANGGTCALACHGTDHNETYP